jgi:hypothetical protein
LQICGGCFDPLLIINLANQVGTQSQPSWSLSADEDTS